MHKVAMIGECMVEMAQVNGEIRQQGFSGDTANSAIYFARAMGQDCEVSYVTALSDDRASQEILALLSVEHVKTNRIRIMPGRMPGSYLIINDECGERSLSYDRSNSPAREMFDGKEGAALLKNLLDFDVWYFSGITLAVLTDESRGHFLKCLDQAKNKGIKICFDTNYRQRLWPNKKVAQQIISQVLAKTDMALVSFDDEQKLFDDKTPEDTIKRLEKSGVNEVVVKQSEKACWMLVGGLYDKFQPEVVHNVVDTTAAGDSFNAAYLAARLAGDLQPLAAEKGAALAGSVIQCRGAITPK